MLKIKKSSQITRVPGKITKRLCKRRVGGNSAKKKKGKARHEEWRKKLKYMLKIS